MPRTGTTKVELYMQMGDTFQQLFTGSCVQDTRTRAGRRSGLNLNSVPAYGYY